MFRLSLACLGLASSCPCLAAQAAFEVDAIVAMDGSLVITLGGEAAGADFHLTVRGDSLVGYMRSPTYGETPVRGRRLPQ